VSLDFRCKNWIRNRDAGEVRSVSDPVNGLTK